MKKITLSLILFVIALWVAAQVPQAFKYQAVARDNAGALLSGQLVSFRIGILAESAEGPVIYSETHGVLANEFGLVNLEIGNGQVEFGEFASIEWENGSLFLQIEMDPEGGEEYQVLGASQLMSVPYALNASSANNAYWIRSGNTIYYTNGSVGIGTASPASSSILELNSATKGLRMPLLTTSQIEDMVDPVEGLVVYNTDVKSLVVFDGLNWYTLVLGECIPQPNVADAGPDQIQNNNQVMTLQGNTAAYGTGTWNVISGSGGEFADPNDPVTEFTGVPFTAYVLEWSISTACSTTVDQVNVSYYAINDIVFVSEDGNDANPGTQNQPVITISKAIELAQGSAKQTIFIAGGNYYETVTLPSGISLYGGFDPATWIKDPENYTTAIYGGTKAVIIEDATNSALDQLAIHSEPATAIGESSYGVFVVQSSGISVTNTHVYAGDGGPGDPGQAGLNGAMGNSGQNGISGCADGSFPCLSSCSQPQGGNGGLSPVGNSGGKGGKGGYGEQAGFTGVTGTGAGGGLGGPGGMSNNYISCVEGGNDSDGLNGDYGLNGTHGSAGLAIGIAGLSGYMAADGGDGTNGQHGGGGGGGGGGRGGNTLTACDSYGSSGGGGGGGGQAGTKGYKGLGAGGSFGIFVFNSSITVESCQITTGDGGTGGSGGLGGYGGSGGYGGYGGAYGGANEQGDAGCGGNGGDGGKGGNGGSGGGGGGGPTIGILNYSSTITETTNTFNLGTSGQGGNSIGNPGSAGVSADVYEL